MKSSCVIKKIVCISSLSLLTQTGLAAEHQQHTNRGSLEQRIAALESKQKIQAKNHVIDPILALPQANYRAKYNTASVYNQDLGMLKLRQSYENEIRKHGITPIPYPRIELGGSLIGVASLTKSPNAKPQYGRAQTDLNLTGANLDINTEITDSLLGNMRISYDPNPPERINRDTITARLNSSSIFLNTAFLTLGDLDRSPFYLSSGQMFIPFGEYDSNLLTATLPTRIGRIKQRPILIGYNPEFIPGLNAQAFVFKGDSYVYNKSGVINNGGGNITYTFSHSLFSLTTAGSYVLNIADSGGMQNTGASTIVSDAGNQIDNSFLDAEDLDEDIEPVEVKSFRGFGAQGFGLHTGESLEHRVPAYDLRAKLKLNAMPISFTGEMVQPTRRFSASNVSYNRFYSAGDEFLPAGPSAWNIESSIKFTLFNASNSFTVGYGHSSEALTFNLPQSSRGVTLKSTFKKVISCALGYQYDMAYPTGSRGTGQGITTKSDQYVGTNTKTLSLQISAKY